MHLFNDHAEIAKFLTSGGKVDISGSKDGNLFFICLLLGWYCIQ